MRAGFLVLGLVATAEASPPLEVRASLGGQRSFDLRSADDERGPGGVDGEGGRFDVAVGYHAFHVRLGASTLSPTEGRTWSHYGNFHGEWATETVSARYVRVGFDGERALAQGVALTVGAGFLAAWTRVDLSGGSYDRGAELIQSAFQRRDDRFRYGGWLETKVSVHVAGARRPFALEIGLGCERLKKDGDDYITRVAAVASVGVAIRWN